MVLNQVERERSFREDAFKAANPSLSITLQPHRRPAWAPRIDRTTVSPSLTLSVVIPAYNEESRIGHTIREYATALHDIDHEILVEVDGSSDGTADLVRDIQSEYERVKLVEFEDRLGKGGGVIEGMGRAGGKWIAYVDADGSTPPNEFLRVASAAFADGSDAVIATRYWDRAGMVANYGFLRWTASRGFNFLVRHAFGLPYRDTQCGMKMFRREAVNAVIPEMKLADYAFDVELLWRLHQSGFKITEVPIRWDHRNGSTVQLARVASRMFLDVLRLRVNP